MWLTADVNAPVSRNGARSSSSAWNGIVRRTVRQQQRERLGRVAPDERHRLVRQHVRHVAAVALRRLAIAFVVIIDVRRPAAAEPDELVEAARVRVIPRVVCAVVPLADEPGRVARGAEAVRHRALTERDAVEPAQLQRVNRARAMRIAPRQQRGPRRGAHRRPGVVLREAHALIDQRIERRRLGQPAVEAGEVPVPHIVGKNEDDVRLAHAQSLPAVADEEVAA